MIFGVKRIVQITIDRVVVGKATAYAKECDVKELKAWDVAYYSIIVTEEKMWKLCSQLRARILVFAPHPARLPMTSAPLSYGINLLFLPAPSCTSLTLSNNVVWLRRYAPTSIISGQTRVIRAPSDFDGQYTVHPKPKPYYLDLTSLAAGDLRSKITARGSLH